MKQEIKKLMIYTEIDGKIKKLQLTKDSFNMLKCAISLNDNEITLSEENYSVTEMVEQHEQENKSV